MAIDLTTEFADTVDEQFAAVSKRSLLTNNNYSWVGAHIVKVYKIRTSEMNDYNRVLANGMTGSRFGVIQDLEATTEDLYLQKDRSFTFAIDKLDEDETKRNLEAGKALVRQNNQVVIPEIDSFVYGIMCENAGTKPDPIELTTANLYSEILNANIVLDNAEVPETDRQLLITPALYGMLKSCKDVVLDTEIGEEIRLKGVIAMLDGCNVIKVAPGRLPENFGFMIAHPSATVAPVKLEDYRIHLDPPGISGSLVEGRICYGATVLDNKKMAIYYQEQKTSN